MGIAQQFREHEPGKSSMQALIAVGDDGLPPTPQPRETRSQFSMEAIASVRTLFPTDPED